MAHGVLEKTWCWRLGEPLAQMQQAITSVASAEAQVAAAPVTVGQRSAELDAAEG
jgi:hypothetical protein